MLITNITYYYMKRIKKMKKRFIAGASGGMLASMLFMGTPALYAETVSGQFSVQTQSQVEVNHRWNSGKNATIFANQLGLSRSEMNRQLKSGKTIKQVLQEKGVDTTVVGKTFSTHKNRAKRAGTTS